jgi:hypothetical protein
VAPPTINSTGDVEKITTVYSIRGDVRFYSVMRVQRGDLIRPLSSLVPILIDSTRKARTRTRNYLLGLGQFRNEPLCKITTRRLIVVQSIIVYKVAGDAVCASLLHSPGSHRPGLNAVPRCPGSHICQLLHLHVPGSAHLIYNALLHLHTLSPPRFT